MELVKKYKGSGRNITTDNFFTSLDLAKQLKIWKLTLVGTVRKNKRFIPAVMLASKERAIHSTNFAYNKDATLCSYVPKKNRAVLLLSTMHSTGVIESTDAAKPEIITYYNSTKGAVDTFDKMLGEYSTKRKTSRYSLALFFNCIDVAALASFIIFTENNSSYYKTTDKRRRFLTELATELCVPAVEERARQPRITRRSSIRAAMELALNREITTASTSSSQQLKAKGPQPAGSCYLCHAEGKPRRKTRTNCSQCAKPTCLVHYTTLCNNCAN